MPAGSTFKLTDISQWRALLFETWNEWNADQAPRLGAALAYYTVLSLAPLLILIIAIAGLVLGQEAAQGQLFYQIRDMVGTDGASAIESMIQSASKPGSGVLATLIGFGMLLFGASSVAAELRASLNVIWGVPYDPNSGIKDMLRDRSYAIGVVLGCGFLLMVSLVVSSFIAGAGKWFSGLLPIPEAALTVLNFVLSVVVISGAFAVLFKYLTEIRPRWSDVLLGAIFTSFLFNVGKMLIGIYLGKASFGSTYGAAGSVIIVLVWVYYSAQIFFFGAEFTEVYARQHGSDPRNMRKVQPVPSPALAHLAHKAAEGNAAFSTGAGDVREGGGLGVVASVAASALALGRIFRAVRRQ